MNIGEGMGPAELFIKKSFVCLAALYTSAYASKLPYPLCE